MPHVVTTARYGMKRGPQVMEDQLDWAYRCPFSQEYMGETAGIWPKNTNTSANPWTTGAI